MKTLKAKFGAAIKTRRLNIGLSQEEFAHRSGLHRTYISDIERGVRNPSLVSIKRICDALDTRVSEIFSAMEKDHSSIG